MPKLKLGIFECSGVRGRFGSLPVIEPSEDILRLGDREFWDLYTENAGHLLGNSSCSSRTSKNNWLGHCQWSEIL